jgi:diguanylate cyclase (GGDEF)-like protein/PAS domain S-box-containing protein
MSSVERAAEIAGSSDIVGETASSRLARLDELLARIEEGTYEEQPHVPSLERENQLPQVRLGIANGLFSALQFKDADTAAHSLRVALTCSAWAHLLDVPSESRDALELAALLHDVGKIGVPDFILLKPGELTPDESAILDQYRRMSLEILRNCCANEDVLEIVEHSGDWYDGSVSSRGLEGEEIPFCARIVRIVDAFDAMTSDHIYRRAMSSERAMAELFRTAGTQFDPQLVERFAQQEKCDLHRLQEQVASRWLRLLEPHHAEHWWQRREQRDTVDSSLMASLFERRLLDNMNDAVVFIDRSQRIQYWNHGAERLTDISSDSVHLRQWKSSLLKMSDTGEEPLDEQECPVSKAMKTGQPSVRRLFIRGRKQEVLSVEAHAVPVPAADGNVVGAALLMHDVSSETSLEERCQNLHEIAKRDPLTQVANRAEFDRVHELFVVVHQEQQLPCSLVMCDIDHFKRVNDTFGHPAGDEVIKSFARLLKMACRSGDLVARYGGEEFVVLCTGCGNAAAARRAEHLRKSFADCAQAALGGRKVTASFGVTEIQPGDTPATMLRRADRALLCAKRNGRNSVVQLGTGSGNPNESMEELTHELRDSLRNLASKGNQSVVGPLSTSHEGQRLTECRWSSWLPARLLLQKLHGFVADHDAGFLSLEGNVARIRMAEEHHDDHRREDDRTHALLMEVRFVEECPAPANEAPQTMIATTLSTTQSRDRRTTDISALAKRVSASLKAYLMAAEIATEPRDPTSST